MIALSATTIKREGTTAVLGADLLEPCGDLGDHIGPDDGLEGAVGSSAQWGRQPVGLVLIIVKPLSLLASITPGIRMRLVTTHLDHSTPFRDDLDATVDIAKITSRLPPRVRVLRFAHNDPPALRAGVAADNSAPDVARSAKRS